MAPPAKSSGRKTGSRKPAGKRTRGRLAPAKEARGLLAADIVLGLEQPEIASLVAQVQQVGGAAIGAYREPLQRPLAAARVAAARGRRADAVPARSLADARQAARRDRRDRRLPRSADRRARRGRPTLDAERATPARGREGARPAPITALVSPDESLAYQILALNTEKAHNLKDRSLEVIRMARSLARATAHATSRTSRPSSKRPSC